MRPIKEADAVSVDVIKAAASAAGEELMGYLRNRLTVLRGGKIRRGQPACRSVKRRHQLRSMSRQNPGRHQLKKKTRTRPAAKKPQGRERENKSSGA